MARYQWNKLTKQQVGAFTEYFVKMELTMHGFQVYTSEVDERGIDFVARLRGGPYLEIQVKSLRSLGYVYMQKTKFSLSEHLYLAFGLLLEEEAPRLYLIPSTAWLGNAQDSTFVGRDYQGLKSDPEWGLNVSKKNMAALEPYLFNTTVEALTAATLS